MKRRVVLLTICAAAVAFGVTVGLAQPPATGPGQVNAQQAPLSPEALARRAKVVAKLGATSITVGDVEDQINAQSPFLRARYRDPERLREFVQNMVRFELLAAEAERRGLGTDEGVVRSVKQNAVQALIRQRFDDRITPESISNDDVRQHYDGHPEEFHRSEMIRASHILVAEREEADRLLAQLRTADARAFRAAAREHSIDTETKLRGGDLRYFTRDGRALNSPDEAVDGAIVAAAFALREVGDVAAEPVRVGSNWSIVKLTGRRPAEHRSLEDADQGIRLRLWRERRQQAIERFVDSLRGRYRPEIHEDRIRPIHLDPTPNEGELAGAHGGAGAGTPPVQEAEAAEEAPAEPEAPTEMR